ncbi:MAG: glycerate 2-kinase [Paracoccaceae bacterium]|jgi:glycerate 2-kinase
MTLTDLKKRALNAFLVGVQAADPELALTKAFEKQSLPPLSGGRYIVISIGKAACKMAETAIKHLPQDTEFTAVAVTNYENQTDVSGCTVFGASHPIPDENGFAAAKFIMNLLADTHSNDCVVACISGGSSALLPAPVTGVSLQDKIGVNKLLLSSGLDITQMNLLRQSLSDLKGGGLLTLAAPAQVRSYILSDVIGDDLRVVGSGPSTPPIGTTAQARQLVEDAGIWDQLPETVQKYLRDPKPDAAIKTSIEPILIGGNRQSAAAMAQAVGAQLAEAPLIGDVQEAAQIVANQVMQAQPGIPFAMAFGGETTVQLKGNGKGGRNQELALRVAQLLQQASWSKPWVFLSGGTDGLDGPTDAAGGMVDTTTLQTIKAQGGDFSRLLANNDSYAALKIADALLIIGATGTNVADIQLFLSE